MPKISFTPLPIDNNNDGGIDLSLNLKNEISLIIFFIKSKFSELEMGILPFLFNFFTKKFSPISMAAIETINEWISLHVSSLIFSSK